MIIICNKWQKLTEKIVHYKTFLLSAIAFFTSVIAVHASITKRPRHYLSCAKIEIHINVSVALW